MINVMYDKIKNPDSGFLILRLALGLLMILHGINKLQNPGTLDWIYNLLQGVGLPSFIAFGVFIGEILAPLMLIIGWKTRLAAFFVVVNMLFAIGLAHTDLLFQLTKHGGWALELQGFYLITALTLLLTGSGRFALRQD